GGRLPRREPQAERSRHQECARRQSLPLRDSRPHCQSGPTRRRYGAGEVAMSKNFIPSRRDLLKCGGALIVSSSFAGRPGESLAQQAAAAKPLALTAVDTFLAIDATGVVTVYSGKVDLGTGVCTALAQIVADELDVP